MNSSRDRWVLGAAVVTESAWLFALLGVAGLAAGLDGSPLDWPVVALIMGVSVVLIRVRLFGRMSAEVGGLLKTAAAALLVYVAIAAELAAEGDGVDLGWTVTVFSDSAPEGAALRAFGGAAAAVLFWLRGARLASVARPVVSLSLSFRIGLVALAFAAVIDILHPSDIGIFPVLFVFFASGLAGLSVGYLMPESSRSARSRTWPKVIAIVVAGVLAVGLGFSALHRGLLSFLSGQFDSVGSLVQVALFVIIAPFVVVFELFNKMLEQFFSRDFDPEAAGLGAGEETGPLLEEVGDAIGQAEFEPSEEVIAQDGLGLEVLMELLLYLFLAATAIAIVVVLAIAIKRMAGPRDEGTRGDPESLRGDSNAASDLARLLAGLVPRLGRRRKGPRGPMLPDGPPGVVEALKLYYDLLSLAEKRGSARPAGQTATEYQLSLEDIFPRNLVRAVTEAFNRALYGRIPATEKQIAQMQTAMEPIRSASRMIRRANQ